MEPSRLEELLYRFALGQLAGLVAIHAALELARIAAVTAELSRELWREFRGRRR